MTCLSYRILFRQDLMKAPAGASTSYYHESSLQAESGYYLMCGSERELTDLQIYLPGIRLDRPIVSTLHLLEVRLQFVNLGAMGSHQIAYYRDIESVKKE